LIARKDHRVLIPVLASLAKLMHLAAFIFVVYSSLTSHYHVCVVQKCPNFNQNLPMLVWSQE